MAAHLLFVQDRSVVAKGIESGKRRGRPSGSTTTAQAEPSPRKGGMSEEGPLHSASGVESPLLFTVMS